MATNTSPVGPSRTDSSNSTKSTVHVYLYGKDLSFFALARESDGRFDARYNFSLSEEQLPAIRLAFRGLGIVLEDQDTKANFIFALPESPPIYRFSVTERLTLPLIYALLERVGYPVESELYWSSPPCEADIALLYFEYPDFDMLLVLGKILIMMSREESTRLKATIIRSELGTEEIRELEIFSDKWLFSKFYNNTCWQMVQLKYDKGELHASNLDNFLEWLDQARCSSYRKYIDEFRKRHSKIIDDARRKELHKAIEKGMEEGYVSLQIIKMVICGPPCVGKTAFKDLLLDKSAPHKHHSTPIAARPIQTIERIAAGGKVWKEVTEEDLLQLLTDIIRNTERNRPELKSLFSYVMVDLPSEAGESQTLGSPTNDYIAALSLRSPQFTTSEALSKHYLHHPLISSPANSNEDSLSYGGADSLSLSNNDSLSIDDEDDKLVSLPRLDFNILSEDFINHFSSPPTCKRKGGSQMLHEATWIYLLDSGGQPQFTDLLRMFVRGNSLYIIVMKVTESLHDKPTFVYSINGKALNTPKEMTMTNLQIIERFVRSVAATSRGQIGDKSEPAFAIIATHCDQSIFKRFFGLEETIREKNKTLLSYLNEFLDLFVFYNRDSNELIFPVNNLCEWSREKISADIRHRLVSSRSGIRGNICIPVRWYVFDLHMKEEALKQTHGMISLESCYNIGQKLGMKKTNVDECLIYLDSMRLCIYYPNRLPHVIFTNPQFLIKCLSDIVRVSFVDDLKQILPDGVSIFSESIESLRKYGVFDESVLNNLGLTFIPNLFSKEDLISLLLHFRVISAIKNTRQYFIPILLPAEHLSKEQKAQFSRNIDPLLITFNKNVVLQGFFSTLIVTLLSRVERPFFVIDSLSRNFPKQLRHAVRLYSENLFGSVFFCEDYDSIEVYFTGPMQHCYLLRSVILDALSSSADILEYDKTKLKISALVHCKQDHVFVPEYNTIPHSITFSDEQNPPMIGCSVEDLPVTELTDARQSYWLIDPYGGILTASIHSNPSLPRGTILNESHAPIILSAIKQIVHDWEVLGIYLGLQQWELEEIKERNKHHHATAVYRKDMIILWLGKRTATREALIVALEGLERGDVAHVVRSLPED